MTQELSSGISDTYGIKVSVEDKRERYLLLNNLRNTVQRILGSTDCCINRCNWDHAGVFELIEVMEKIFTQGLIPGYGRNHDIKYPGFLTVLQWCLDSSEDTGEEKSVIQEIQQSLCKEGDRDDESEIKVVVKILQNEIPLNAIIKLLQGSSPIGGNYHVNTFMRNHICSSVLLSCLKAIHLRSPRALSELPLPGMNYSYLSILKLPDTRIHVAAQAPSRDVLHENHNVSDRFLPDVVACTKKEDRNDTSLNSDSTIVMTPYNESEDSIEFSEALQDTSEVDDSESYEIDCSQENAQLHLSELLITVIQGRTSGMSNPDLLKSVNQAVSGQSSDGLMEQASSIKRYCTSNIGSGLEELQSSHCRSSTFNDDDDSSLLGNGRLEWCVFSDEVPQSFLPVPSSAMVSYDEESYSFKGYPQLDLNPVVNMPYSILPKKQALASQKYKCSGCGRCLRDSRGGFKRCHLLHLYFCRSCHDNHTSRVIPSRVFHMQDFKRYKVSKVACEFLDEIHHEPLFNPIKINPDIYRKNKKLSQCQDLRKQGHRVLKKIESCPHPWMYHDSAVMEKLKSLPFHILRGDLSIYSISDLVNVNNGSLLKQMKLFNNVCLEHMQMCNVCSQN